MLRFDIKGEQELLGKLKAWELEKRARVMDALDRAALTLEEQWKRGAAVDTGRYRSSVRVRREAVASANPARSGAMTREVTSDVEYAPHVEYGTKNMKAQPAAEPAADVANAQFKRDVRRILK